jgi:hypothetical protein
MLLARSQLDIHTEKISKMAPDIPKGVASIKEKSRSQLILEDKAMYHTWSTHTNNIFHKIKL